MIISYKLPQNVISKKNFNSTAKKLETTGSFQKRKRRPNLKNLIFRNTFSITYKVGRKSGTKNVKSITNKFDLKNLNTFIKTSN